MLTPDIKLYSLDQETFNEGLITGLVAGVPVQFLIDSGADVNTVDESTFNQLLVNGPTVSPIYSVVNGTDRPLKAYGMIDDIPVTATFIAELFISKDRPTTMEKFDVVRRAQALLSRSTSIRYSVLEMGVNTPIRDHVTNYLPRLQPGEIFTLTEQGEFPKFRVDPVILNYDKSLPPSRNVFTSIPPAFRAETENRLEDLLAAGIIERVTDSMERSFCSSLLVVPKGKNDIRLVVDLVSRIAMK